jgi:ATPase subunit of ABC transporter with duplicated ATPase domains
MASVSAGDRVLWAESISKTYDGSRYQFKNITVNIPSGAKIALLGANGGKD